MKYYRLIYITSLLLLSITVFSCNDEFLDQKPDLSKAVPKSLADCQAMLDDYSRMNAGYPDQGEAAADNYYLTDASYAGLTDYGVEIQESKDNYIWNTKGEHVSQWTRGYQVIYSANMILNVLENLSPTDPNYNHVRGSALFYRAFAFYHLAQLFCQPFKQSSENNTAGIPLRLTPDPNEKSTRGTVQQVYDRIIQDLNEATSLLSVAVSIKSRPSKPAAYAALARVYLAMMDYPKAEKVASECLKLQNYIIDYNNTSNPATATSVSSIATGPSFMRFNAEVIFQAVTASATGGSLGQAMGRINPELYGSYATNDRRKTVFFGEGMEWWGDPNGLIGFRGNYDGIVSGSQFMGLSTNEVYLIRAECYARAGNIGLAMADLNTLLSKRMIPPYINRTATSANDALIQVLRERRKELIFRTLRWTDLRRLNQDPQFAIVLRRNMNNISYTPLEPNDLRYVFLIPTKEVINRTGMDQNPR